MQRREFIVAMGGAAAAASDSQAFAQATGDGGAMEDMHPPLYRALEKTSMDCVATGHDT